MALTAFDRSSRTVSLRGDADTGALSVISSTHEKIHAGTAYRYQLNASAAAQASGVFALGYLTTSGTTVETHLRVTSVTATSAAKIVLYEFQGTTASAGIASSGFSASATPVNCDRFDATNRTKTMAINFYTGSGFSSASANELDRWVLGASGVSGFRMDAGAEDSEFELKPNTVYAFYYINPATATESVIQVRLFAYDVTPNAY